ncbi:family 10 glycosylhydrolase, partial [bacterium]|nr:family 10 glycosylhydrolase [bacterium]
PAACDSAATAADRLRRAYCAAQQPRAGEFRAWWCHSALGVEGLTWDQALERLADNGFTAILPNMLWGGAAFYPSAVLPVAAAVAANGDQLAACVAAGKKHGIQVHVWKVNWYLGGRAPEKFVAELRRQGRLQANARGEELLWLCPSHPDNQRLEIASMIEVARRYDVDGLHFDYIRYPDAGHCFCAGCQERFGQATGAAVRDWPRDVREGGARRPAWLDWRRGNITAVVKAVSDQARAIKPEIKLSAAVFRNWEVDRDQVGQDWKQWCEAGYLDFVCPMDYTAGDVQFENWVVQQQRWAGRTPCYPGIGVSASHSTLPPDQVIAQINITRRRGTGGFVLFNYGPGEARDLLPLLGLGITARR